MANPAGDEDLDHLRSENAERKREVARLRDEMDKIQHRRHAKKKPGKDADSKLNLVTAEVRIAIKQNEDLRRERLKLTAEIQHSDTGRRIAEVKNELTFVEKQIELKQSELKALEFQKKGRKDVVELAKHNEEELRLFRAQHREALNGFKDEAHELSEEQKGLDRQMIAMQVHIHRIMEKIKLGVNGEAFAEMKNQVAQQNEELAQLRDQLAQVSQDMDKDTKNENAELKNLRNDREALKARLDSLKQTMVERERELKLSYNLNKTGVSPRPKQVSA